MDIKLINFKNIPYELQLKTRNWRNLADVTKFFKIKYITKDMHEKWLSSLMQKQPPSIAFVIYADNIPIGVTYFHSIDYNNKFADWGIYIYDKHYRGQGIGRYALNYSIEFAKQELQLKFLFLDVMLSNHSAINLYTSFGFELYSEKENNFLRYIKELRSL